MLAIEKEGEALVKEMEKTVNKHKKIAIIGAVCLGVIMVAVLIAKIIL
jgi:mannose/fructose/N-acetylgalactosamine-specific phosphotransferase system component IID